MTGTTDAPVSRYLRAVKEHWLNIAPIGLFAVFGLWMTSLGAAERAVGEAPRVTPAEVEAYAGTGTPVILVARAVAVPPLEAASGEQIALQWVSLSHTRQVGDRLETVIDYEALAPAELWAAEGNVAVRVVTEALDPRYIAERVRGETALDGSLPDEARALMSDAFDDIPRRGGLDLSIRAIGNGDPVAVYGLVEIENGEPVLRAPGGGRPFAVAGMGPEEFVAAMGGSARFNTIAGWAVIAFALFLAGLAVWYYGRSASLPEAP